MRWTALGAPESLHPSRRMPRPPTAARMQRMVSRAERQAAGKQCRVMAPLESHSAFDADADRDPVGLLLGQAQTRVPELVPVRHGRMLTSPFAYFRGAALPMAADLARTPTSGLQVQLCGDAHLANFGAFASPERRLVFDLNDFDETLPGPFEWDVKRLAASLVVAARDNGFPRQQRRRIVRSAIGAYRLAMRAAATTPMLDVWYSHLDIEAVVRQLRSQLRAEGYKALQAALAKAHTRDSTQALRKLTTMVDGRPRIVSAPPLIVPVEEVFDDVDEAQLYAEVRRLMAGYARTLQTDRRHLLQQFELVHMARKVVGVGSVGTRAWIVLMASDDGQAPLFLQAKQAERSVLDGFVGRTRQRNQGERVVNGQRLMQAVSDIFLGWQRVTGQDGVDRDYYVRQLRDWKVSVPVELMLPSGLEVYAGVCARTLARAHARTGDRVALASYLGSSDRFDRAISDFAEAYADLNERDYDALAQAVASGRVSVQHGG